MPSILRAPEINLGHPWGFPVDVWSVGCLALELIMGDTIFNIDHTADTMHTDVHLARIAGLLGPFPPQFLEACTRRAEHFYPRDVIFFIRRVFLAPGARRLSASPVLVFLVKSLCKLVTSYAGAAGRSSGTGDINRAFGRCLAARVTISGTSIHWQIVIRNGESIIKYHSDGMLTASASSVEEV